MIVERFHSKYLRSAKKKQQKKSVEARIGGEGSNPLLGQNGRTSQLCSKLNQEPLSEGFFDHFPHLLLLLLFSVFGVCSFRDDGVGHLLFWIMKFVPVVELIWLNISVIFCWLLFHFRWLLTPLGQCLLAMICYALSRQSLSYTLLSFQCLFYTHFYHNCSLPGFFLGSWDFCTPLNAKPIYFSL